MWQYLTHRMDYILSIYIIYCVIPGVLHCEMVCGDVESHHVCKCNTSERLITYIQPRDTDVKKSWDQARNACSSYRLSETTLLTIEDEDENDRIKELLSRREVDLCWMGLECDDDDATSCYRGEFHWDGTTSKWTFHNLVGDYDGSKGAIDKNGNWVLYDSGAKLFYTCKHVSMLEELSTSSPVDRASVPTSPDESIGNKSNLSSSHIAAAVVMVFVVLTVVVIVFLVRKRILKKRNAKAIQLPLSKDTNEQAELAPRAQDSQNSNTEYSYVRKIDRLARQDVANGDTGSSHPDINNEDNYTYAVSEDITTDSKDMAGTDCLYEPQMLIIPTAGNDSAHVHQKPKAVISNDCVYELSGSEKENPGEVAEHPAVNHQETMPVYAVPFKQENEMRLVENDIYG